MALGRCEASGCFDVMLKTHKVRIAVFNVNTILLSLNFFAIITP